MLPHDLPCSQFQLPPGPRDSLVIITGGLQPRFLHFAYRMQADFPTLVKKWYAIQSNASAVDPVDLGTRWHQRIWQVYRDRGSLEFCRSVARRLRPRSILATLHRRFEQRLLRQAFDLQSAESQVFGETVNRLRPRALVEPTVVSSPNEERVIAELNEIRPYFLVSLGGPLISPRVLQTVRGLPINTHAGCSPEMRGTQTTAQALYHRRLDWVGNTVHVTTSGADSGPILRRSLAAIFDDDSPQDCFFRVVALGNELMSDTIRDLLERDSVSVFDQSGKGNTYRSIDFTHARRLAIARDFQRGWLADALAEERTY